MRQKQAFSAIGGYFLFVFVGLMFFSLNAFSQVTPDSTSGGKGKIKDDRRAPVDSIIVVTDTPVVDTPVVSGGKGDLKSGREDVAEGEKEKEKKKKDKKARAEVKPDANAGPVAKKKHDPKIAVRRALILPGWGQIYNRRWWKLPLVYGGFAVTTFFIIDNHSKYKQFQEIGVCKGDTTCDDATLYPDYALFDLNGILSIRDFHRRYRDLNVILTVLWYTIQAVDAYVDAHLKDFNVSEDLSMRIRPSLNLDPFQQPSIGSMYMGATISLKLRK